MIPIDVFQHAITVVSSILHCDALTGCCLPLLVLENVMNSINSLLRRSVPTAREFHSEYLARASVTLLRLLR